MVWHPADIPSQRDVNVYNKIDELTGRLLVPFFGNLNQAGLTIILAQEL